MRPEPPAISCPQDWRDTHKRYNVTRDGGAATVKGYKAEPGNVASVKNGPAALQVDVDPRGFDLGDLPRGTMLLGQWRLGDNRLFGTFTEAKIPGVGTFPVCLVAGIEGDGLGFQGASYLDEHGKSYLCPPGLGVCLTPGSTPGNAKTNAGVSLVVPTGQP